MHAIILAAGSSRRFGANKLISLLNGRPLFSYALENALSCPEITDITVVTRYREIEEYIEKNVDILMRLGQKTISVIHNPFADEGISSSIRTGTRAFMDAELHDEGTHLFGDASASSVIFMVADQPFLKKDTLCRLTASHTEAVKRETIPVISMLCCGDMSGNPVVFTRDFLSELLMLKGDTGGKAVIKKAVSCGMRFFLNRLYTDDEKELHDIDTKEDMKKS